MINKNYKRQHRELDDATKERISASLRGRSKSTAHAQNIAQSMREYWATVPSRESIGANGSNGSSQNNKKSNIPQSDEAM